VVLDELGTRLDRQVVDSQLAQSKPEAEMESYRAGLNRALRVVRTLAGQIGAGELPQGLDVLVEPDPEPPQEMGPVA
jgi:hypothetical protein